MFLVDGMQRMLVCIREEGSRGTDEAEAQGGRGWKRRKSLVHLISCFQALPETSCTESGRN